MRSRLIYFIPLALMGCDGAQKPTEVESFRSDQPQATTREAKLPDGPFGIAFNKPVPDGFEPLEGQPNHYKTSSPPKKHPDFDEVVVKAFPSIGVCAIRGIGKTINSDGSGAMVRSKVDSLAAALETKYGRGKKNDVCGAGDISCSSEFWMMTLEGGERGYAYLWSKQTEEMKAAGIGSLAVGAAALNIVDSYPIIEFESDQKKACEDASKASSASAH